MQGVNYYQGAKAGIITNFHMVTIKHIPSSVLGLISVESNRALPARADIWILRTFSKYKYKEVLDCNELPG